MFKARLDKYSKKPEEKLSGRIKNSLVRGRLTVSEKWFLECLEAATGGSKIQAVCDQINNNLKALKGVKLNVSDLDARLWAFCSALLSGKPLQ